MLNHARYLFTAARRSTALRTSAAAGACLAVMAGCATQPSDAAVLQPAALAADLSGICQIGAIQAVADKSEGGITIKAVPLGPVPDGVRYVAATDDLPAYCQITGSYVTNPETGKTANFLAALPANWNGKYLQIGCSGHCGNFFVSDATSPMVTISIQGTPGDVLRRGYASFATDEGHSGLSGGDWAKLPGGGVNQDAIDDFLYRAQMVLSHTGKALTRAFYAEAEGAPQEISRSYFSGCSGGGRDALVAANLFPEQFDGIISGSPYANMVGTGFQTTGVALAYIRSEDADVLPTLMDRIAPIVMDNCDQIDGIKDGLIQNPAACNFRPERDLPTCADGAASDQCFTPAQIETISTYLTAVTDERGVVLQPGLAVSNLQGVLRVATPPVARDAAEPWPDIDNTPGGSGGMWALGDATIKTFAHRNDPAFHTRSLIGFAQGGSGDIRDFRVVVSRADFDRVSAAVRKGIGAAPENADRLIQQDRKLMIWSNGSDQLLTPYMAINYYQTLAQRHGGYDKLQDNVRLFSLPGTVHCSMGGVGVNNFDALGAMENWVERGQAPNALLASLFSSRTDPRAPLVTLIDYKSPPLRTMPLCAYPAMARYNGRGDVNDGANWTCSANDRRMLTLGESGRRAGIGPFS